jgi:hypothetical protein
MTEDGRPREPVRPGTPIVGASRPGIPSGPRRAVARGGPNSRWPQYVQFLVVVTVTVLFLLLAVSMQRHHFMNGEFYDRSHPTN